LNVVEEREKRRRSGGGVKATNVSENRRSKSKRKGGENKNFS